MIIWCKNIINQQKRIWFCCAFLENIHKTFKVITQVTNYVITTYFLVICWLQTNVTKKWQFHNVTSVRNSNVLKYNVILTSFKNVTTWNKETMELWCNKKYVNMSWRAKMKCNCSVISIRNSNVTKYNVILTLSKNVTTSNK